MINLQQSQKLASFNSKLRIHLRTNIYMKMKDATLVLRNILEIYENKKKSRTMIIYSNKN